MEYNSKYNLSSLKRIVGVISLGSFLYISFYGSYLLNKVSTPDQVYLFIGVSFVLTILASISIYLYDKRTKEIFGGNPAAIIEVLRSIDSSTDLSDNLNYNYDDGIYAAVDRLRINIGSRFSSNEIENKSTETLKNSLEELQAQVMVADSDLNIVYVNDSAKKMFLSVEKEIRKSIPNFSSNDLIGSNIDKFHKNPHHQRSLLSTHKIFHLSSWCLSKYLALMLL
jgi:PAS domain-containing protein